MLNFPAETFLRFCINHGLLQVNNRPRWKTVLGGSKVYVQKMAERIHHVRTGCPVVEVKRDDDGVELVLGHGNERFDFAVMACHADQSLKILCAAALEPERQVLSAVDYTDNTAVLHLDRSFLPKREKAWAAWNYVAPAKAQADSPLSVTYLLNMLQPLKTTAPVLCTLNPHRTIDPTKILHEVHFRHPRFNHAAIQAQRHLPHIQRLDRLWFCGAWTRYGFHEDGYLSALHVVDHMNKLLNSRHQTDSLANSASVVS
jgi:predicted NAD/FAD-binding protein